MIREVSIHKEKIYDRDLMLYTEAKENLNEVLLQAVEKYPDKEMLVFGDKRISYREFYELVTKAAATLQHEYNFQKGDRLGIFSHNTLEYCISIFSASMLGGIIVPLNTKLRPTELQYMFKDAGITVLIVEDELIELVEDTMKFVDSTFETILIGSNYDSNKYVNFEKLLASSYELKPVKVYKTDPLFIMYTSGTTGLPKGALGTHLGITQNVLNFSVNLNTNHHDRTLISAPLFHVTGLVAALTHMIYVGGTSVIMHKFSTNDFLALLSNEKITYINTVPTIFIFLLNHPKREAYDLSNLKTAVTGGSPMPVKVIEKLMELYPHLKFINNYGATESTGSCTFSRAETALTKADSVGGFSDFIEWKVVDKDGVELPRGEVGELYIKGPIVIPEYWNNPEATSNEFSGAYWKSGDLGYVDNEDYFYLMDRKKNMVNRAGENIYTAEIENVLYNHPSIYEAAVVGVPDEVFGEEVLASIVLKEGKELLEKEAREFLTEYLASYKVPKYIEFTKELPRNASGKILKNVVKESYKKI